MEKVSILRMRHAVFRAVREFFDGRGFIEVHTPLLVKNPGLEPYLVPFETTLLPGMGSTRKETLYLPTSPEYHLKKALALGLDKIYEISRSFRNGELGHRHEPEFHMLEWYRAPGTYDDIALDTAELVGALAEQFDSTHATLWKRVETLTVAEAFERYAGIDLNQPLVPQAVGTASVEAGDDFDTAFGKVIVDKIEPRLGFNGLTVLKDYPASQAALARLKPQDRRYAERFEVYWRGVELANAFQELTDSAEQRARCLEDQQKRRKLYGKTPPLDEEFLTALDQLPAESSGIALGLDRLIQCLVGAPTLQDILAFPHRKPV